MIAALLVISLVDFALSGACLVCLVTLIRRKPPASPDPDAIARAILRSPFDAVDVREAMAVDRYLLQYTQSGVTKVVYEGTDSDRAYAAHRDMELHPHQYPGRHEYRKNGRTIVDRLHSEIDL